MPRQALPLKRAGEPSLRYLDELGEPLFVAVDVARAIGFQGRLASGATYRWRCKLAQLRIGDYKEWRMLTADMVREAIYRSDRLSDHGKEMFNAWFADVCSTLPKSMGLTADNLPGMAKHAI